MAFGRASVRAAVKTYFTPPAVSGLNTLYSAWPKRGVPWPDYIAGQPAGTQSGTVAVVHLARDDERRLAVGGSISGKKVIEYAVELQLMLRSTKAKAEDAVDDYDAVVDAVKARLRYDRSLGTGSARGADDGDIWQAGEGDLWGEYFDPQITVDGATEIWGAVHFVCVQHITS